MEEKSLSLDQVYGMMRMAFIKKCQLIITERKDYYSVQYCTIPHRSLMKLPEKGIANLVL